MDSFLEANLEAKIERLIKEKLSKALSNLARVAPRTAEGISQPTQPTQLTPVKKQDSVD